MTSLFYRATLETRHYSFEAYGESEARARQAMRTGWRRHCKQHDMPDNWAEFADDVYIYPIRIGWVYRDHERLWAGLNI